MFQGLGIEFSMLQRRFDNYYCDWFNGHKKEAVKSQFDCHIEFIEILTIKLIAFDKLRLTILLRQPL